MPPTDEPLPTTEFWALIDTLAGHTDPRAIDQLTTALRTAGHDTAVAFQHRLATTLRNLDHPDLAHQPIRWNDDPDGTHITLTADTFLSLRAAIIAAGQQATTGALTDPATVTHRTWDDGELLLTAAEHAAGYPIDTVDYETGTNTDHWPTHSHDPDQHHPLAVLHLHDLTNAIPMLAFDSDEPGEPLILPPPRIPFDLVLDLGDELDHAVRGGGIPTHLDVAQLQAHLTFDDHWNLTPTIDARVDDDVLTRPVARAHVALDTDDAQTWTRQQTRTALLAAAASALLTLLPADHAGRATLEHAAAAGTDLLPHP